jgi:RNase H-fold protein (predicted Holliday junction resolvase)
MIRNISRLSQPVIRSYVARQQKQLFHSSGTQSLDLFGFLKGRKEQAAPVPSTKKLIKDIEERESRNEVSLKEPVDLEVIGLPPRDYSVWTEEERNGFTVEAFPISQVNSELTGEQVQAALVKAYNEINAAAVESISEEIASKTFEDFNARLQFLKSVEKTLKTAVSDSKIIELDSIQAIANHFNNFVIGRQFNEKEPDAIYLNPEDFKGTNITLVDESLSTKKAKSKTWDRLVEQARKAQEEELEKSLEGVNKN